MNLEDAKAKVSELSTKLEKRRPGIKEQLDYLTGRNGTLRYASEKFAQYNKNRYKGFSDNWCLPVASAPAERMTFLGLRPYGMQTGVDDALQRTWETVNGDTSSSEAFLVREATGRAFSLVHPSGSPDKEPALTFEHPETAIVEKDPVTGEDRYGLVTWVDGSYDYATLYSPASVMRFRRKTSAFQVEDTENVRVALGRTWEQHPDFPQPQSNPLGEVPLTELPNQSLLDDEPMSGISGVMALQDSTNLIWAYLLNALDQASLPARVVAGADLPQVPVLGADGTVQGYEDVELDSLTKERILFLQGDQVTVSEWSAANLEAFWQVIERIVEHIAAQTRTPPHYLVAKMVNTSGDALNIAEAGLVSKVAERITYATPAMKKTMRLLAKAKGADEKRLGNIQAGKLVWKPHQYRSESQMADAIGKYRSAGMPMRWIVEKVEVDPAEVQRVMDMIDEERAADPLNMVQAAIRQPPSPAEV